MVPTMNNLAELLEQRRNAITAALEDARGELEAIRRRESQLLALIREAEAALGTPSSAPAVERQRLTLHEALVQILCENDD